MYFYDSYEEEDSVSIQDKQNVSQNIEMENMNMYEPVQRTRTTESLNEIFCCNFSFLMK